MNVVIEYQNKLDVPQGILNAIGVSCTVVHNESGSPLSGDLEDVRMTLEDMDFEHVEPVRHVGRTHPHGRWFPTWREVWRSCDA